MDLEKVNDSQLDPFEKSLRKAETIVAAISAQTKSGIKFTVALPSLDIPGNISASIPTEVGKGRGLAGFGIISRLQEEIEQYAPGLKEQLLNCTGKILFLGNGFSDYPLLVTARHRAGIIKKNPLITDIFDYALVVTDLAMLIENLREYNIAPPLGLIRNYRNLAALLQAEKDGHLKIVKHQLGRDEVPDELKECDLIINVFGPSLSVLQEQLRLLGPNGTLYLTHIDTPLLMRESPPDGYEKTGVKHDIRAWIYRKMA